MSFTMDKKNQSLTQPGNSDTIMGRAPKMKKDCGNSPSVQIDC